MKKKKRLIKIATRPVSDSLAAAAQPAYTGQTAYIPAGSLLNKYNQKKPSGTKKLSPAADEEME